jgi:predicted nucleic acid-binding protein
VSLAEFLHRHRRIGLDTSVFIYAVEAHPKYAELAGAVFSWIESRHGSAVTSTVTMLELLVQPYRQADLDRVNRFYALISTYPHLEWVAPSLEIADLGAQLRAEHGLRTPDAIHAATALACGVTGFVCNDPVFRRVTGGKVALLEQLNGG